MDISFDRAITAVCAKRSHSLKSLFAVCMAGLCLVIASATVQAQENQWVRPGATGNLLYTMDGRGDRILDFSTVGYQGGTVPLPQYNEVVSPDRIITVAPSAGDNRAAIQAAIDQVQSLSLNEHGFRGVVQLQEGNYDISDTLRITQSGIILRGTGKERSGGTVMTWTGTAPAGDHEPFMVQVGTSNAITINSASTRTVIDKVVPTGARSLRVDSTTGYKAGDHVLVERRPNEAWVDRLGMRDFSDGDPDWDPQDPLFHSQYERVVTHVDHERGRIFFDAPIAQALEQRYGTTTVSHYDNHRINHVGIENIRGDGQKVFVSPTDENHANSFIYFDAVEDSWVRSITGENLIRAAARFETTSKNNTLIDGEFVAPISTITGMRRYAFWMDGQLNLMRNMEVEEARHAFISNKPSRGPNVFLYGQAIYGYSDSGPHRQYSTGTLYDNIDDDSAINVRNRGHSGTRHGWAGGNMVIWNSQTSSFTVQNPPDGQNWLIGSTGNYSASSNGYYPAYVDAHGEKQTLNGFDSLYMAQLAQRMANPNNLLLEYWVGDFDEYEYNAATDDNLADPQWIQKLSDAHGNSYAMGQMDAFPDWWEPEQIVPVTVEFDVPDGYTPISAVLTISSSLGYYADDDRLILLEDVALDDAISVADLEFLPRFDLSEDVFRDTDIIMLELLAADLDKGLEFLLDGQLDLAVLGSQRTDWVDLQITFAPTVPEPTTMMLVVGATMWIGLRRSR